MLPSSVLALRALIRQLLRPGVDLAHQLILLLDQRARRRRDADALLVHLRQTQPRLHAFRLHPARAVVRGGELAAHAHHIPPRLLVQSTQLGPQRVGVRSERAEHVVFRRVQLTSKPVHRRRTLVQLPRHGVHVLERPAHERYLVAEVRSKVGDLGIVHRGREYRSALEMSGRFYILRPSTLALGVGLRVRPARTFLLEPRACLLELYACLLELAGSRPELAANAPNLALHRRLHLRRKFRVVGE